jgi:hypothetical protein
MKTLKEKVNSTGSAQFSSINVYIHWMLMPLFLGLFDEFAEDLLDSQEGLCSTQVVTVKDSM